MLLPKDFGLWSKEIQKAYMKKLDNLAEENHCPECGENMLDDDEEYDVCGGCGFKRKKNGLDDE